MRCKCEGGMRPVPVQQCQRVALVTGGGSGLGRATAYALSQAGFRVVVNDLGTAADGQSADGRSALETVSLLRSAGGEAVADTSSVADPVGAEKMVDLAVGSFGGLDVVVHSAGIIRDRTIGNLTDEDWDAVVDTNLRGT